MRRRSKLGKGLRAAGFLSSIHYPLFTAKSAISFVGAIIVAPLMDSTSSRQGRQRRIKRKLFLWSLIVSAALFLAFDWLYSAAILQSAVAGNTQGFCFARDPVRHFAFQPNCECTRPWLRDSYKFYTNNLGFRDERIRDVPLAVFRPRILILGDSAPEGMTSWSDSFIGRVAANFPQYEFLNGSVEGYSPSNYLNTARMVLEKGIDIDEVVVFIDLSDVQDEAAFFHDKDASGAVGIANQKYTKESWYSKLRLYVGEHLLITNDILQFFERNLVKLGWYQLELGHGGNEFDLERSAWTYRKVSETEPYETGYAPLGVEDGIAREKAKMDLLWQELQERNIPLSVVVYPWPAQLAHDSADSRQVRIWRDWCEGRCKRFVSLFPAFFAVKERCPKSEPGCWYLNYFIFGDTHYNSAGDALVADVISESLAQVPPVKREPPVAVQEFGGR